MKKRMNPNRIAAICTGIVLIAAAHGMKAQAAPGAGPRSGFRGVRPGPIAPDDALGFVGFEAGLSGRTVTGAPFTADVTSETTQVLADGNRIDNKTTGKLARDSEGRTRRELTLPLIGGYSTSENGNAPAHAIVINDPVAGVSYVLNENRKTARQRHFPAGLLRGGSRAPGAARGATSPNVTTESLGTQMIGGVEAQGTRTTRTIPAGAIGNEKAILITVERWYSAELQMDILIKRSDPRGGTSVFQVTNVVHGEPDGLLFQVPSDYTVISGRGARGGANAPSVPPSQP